MIVQVDNTSVKFKYSEKVTKNWKKISQLNDVYYHKIQINWEILTNLSGLLRIYEL
jgi:hypothetical protein